MEALQANSTSLVLGGIWGLLALYNLVNLGTLGALPFGMIAFVALCILSGAMILWFLWRAFVLSEWKDFQANQIRKKNRPRF